MSGVAMQVCTTTAASQAEASAFLTPADASGSMKLAASPTSRKPSPAKLEAVYWEAVCPLISLDRRASATRRRASRVLSSSAR